MADMILSCVHATNLLQTHMHIYKSLFSLQLFSLYSSLRLFKLSIICLLESLCSVNYRPIELNGILTEIIKCMAHVSFIILLSFSLYTHVCMRSLTHHWCGQFIQEQKLE